MTTQPAFVKKNTDYFAAIDLGSSNCRLLIAEKQDNKMVTVETYARLVRLGEGVSKSGKLSSEAIERTVHALAQCAERIKRFKPIKVLNVATEACRKASNRDVFFKRVQQETGLKFKVISHYQEAYFALRGCKNLLNPMIPYAIVFDIGGGSTELLWTKVEPNGEAQIIDALSLPFGVINLSEEFQPESAESYHKIRTEVLSALERFSMTHDIYPMIENGKVQMLGTSGTATTAAALHLGLRYYDRLKIDGLELNFESVFSVIKQVQLMTEGERSNHPCIGRFKNDLVLGGLAVFDGICSAWDVGSLKVADRGVRDGIVSHLAFCE